MKEVTLLGPGEGFWEKKSEGPAQLGWDWPCWEMGIFSHGFGGVVGQSLPEAFRCCVCCSRGKISRGEVLGALLERVPLSFPRLTRSSLWEMRKNPAGKFTCQVPSDSSPKWELETRQPC